MINFIKKHKNVFIGLFLVLFIFSLFILIIYFENKDRENVKKTVLSDINLVEDSNNLNKSWSINNDGNLVGNNLITYNHFNGSVIDTSSDYGILWPIEILSSGIYSIYFQSNSSMNGANYSYMIKDTTNWNTRGYCQNNEGFTFTLNTNSKIAIYIRTNTPINNLNVYVSVVSGSTIPTQFEPYGIYYSQTNYNDYGDLKYSQGYSNGYNQASEDIYVNNPFYNASVKYYTTLSSVNPWFTFTLNNTLLQNSNTFDVNQAVKTFLTENEQQDYYDSPDIGYFKVDFVKSFNASEMIYLVNAQYPFQFDHYFTFYFDDGSQYVFHNSITNNSSEYYYQYDVSLANTDKNGMRVVGLSFRRGARDIVNSVSQSQYNIGYNDGYSVGYNKAVSNDNDTITSLNNDISELNSQVESLTYQLNVANENAQNDLNGLTYTMVSAVMSTPFNILHDMLNFNFFGINVFSLFTSLITLLLLIWVIKFLIGRK